MKLSTVCTSSGLLSACVLVLCLSWSAAPVRAQNLVCTPANASLVVVNSYLDAAFAGNLNAAGAFVTSDFIFDWHADTTIIPFAGTYVGIAGLGTYLSPCSVPCTLHWPRVLTRVAIAPVFVH
jgi:hypothetical protein